MPHASLRRLLATVWTSVANGLYMRVYGSLPDLDGEALYRLSVISRQAMGLWAEGDAALFQGLAHPAHNPAHAAVDGGSASLLLLLCYRGFGCALFWQHQHQLASVVLERAIQMAEQPATA